MIHAVKSLWRKALRALWWSAVTALPLAASFAVLMSYNEVFAASILTIERPTLPALVLNALSASPDPYKFAAAWLLTLPASCAMAVLTYHLVRALGM